MTVSAHFVLILELETSARITKSNTWYFSEWRGRRLGAVLIAPVQAFGFIGPDTKREDVGNFAELPARRIPRPAFLGLPEQGIERAGTKAGNKGWDAAMSAIEMVNLYGSMS